MGKTVFIKETIELGNITINKGLAARVKAVVTGANDYLLGYVIAIPFQDHTIELVVRPSEIEDIDRGGTNNESNTSN